MASNEFIWSFVLFFKKRASHSKEQLANEHYFLAHLLLGFEVGGSRSPLSIVALCPPGTLPPRGPTSLYLPAGLLSSPGL